MLAGRMEHLIDQIRGTLRAGFPYAALMLAVSVPDVCANLELPEGRGSDHVKLRYLRWYDRYVSPKGPVLTGNNCYDIRCGKMHQGQLGSKDLTTVIVFTDDDNMSVVCGDVEERSADGELKRRWDVLVGISIREFCGMLIAAAEDWHVDWQNNPMIKTNLKHLVRTYEDGYPLTDDVTFLKGVRCIG